MTFSLRLTHQIALVVILPLLIELAFLVSLLGILTNIRDDRKEEAVAIKTLAAVNLVLNDVVKCGNLLLFNAPSGEQDVTISFNYVGMQNDEHDLKLLMKEEHLQSSKLRAFTEAVDKLIDTADASFDQGPAEFVESSHVSGLLEKEVLSIIESGALVIKELSETRTRKTELRNLHEEKLEQTVQYGTVTTLTVAALLALYLLLRFGNGLGTLMANTTNLATGRPLLPRVKGNDELGRLDDLIHSLSDELQRSRGKERALIDNTALILCSVNDTFHIVEMNRAVQKILGYEVEELLGSIFPSFVLEEDRAQFLEHMESSQVNDSVQTFETRLLGKDGDVLNCEVTVHWSEENLEFFCSIQDVSERKESERLKAEVMELISMDLRAPLSAIARDLESLRNGSSGSLNDRGGRLTKTAAQSVSSLMALVGDLLDIEKLESDSTLSLAYAKISCSALLERAVDMVRAGAEKKRLSLTTEADGVDMEVDPDRLTRVIVNLLGNAIKFSPEGKSIDCSAKLLDTESGTRMVEFRFKDEGPGIAEEKLDTIFEKFHQADLGMVEEKAGSGLGLAICRAIVDAHDGNIGVESVMEQGSTFWFRVPAGPRA